MTAKPRGPGTSETSLRLASPAQPASRDRVNAAVAAAAVTVLLARLAIGSDIAAVQEGASETDGVQAVLSARQARLAELNNSVASLESRLERTDRQADDLLGQAGRARARAELQREKLARARLALENAREDVAYGEGKIALLEEDISELRNRMARSARTLYRFGRFAYLRVFFSLEDSQRVLPALRQLRYLTQRDGTTLSRLRETEEVLRTEQVALTTAERELARLVPLEQEEATRLRREERRLAALARELEQRRRRIADEVLEQRERSQRLTKLMEILADEGSGGLADRPIQGFRGGLDWPVEGTVSKGFGLQRDPKYGTMVQHNGLELEAQEGSGVQVVYPGRVIFAAPFQDLGFTVVVQHEEAVLTLYAGLSELSTAEGDVLALGDSVGVIGERLYFELRYQRRPEDPSSWLR